MNEGAAGVSKKSHAVDDRGIPPFTKRRVGAPGDYTNYHFPAIFRTMPTASDAKMIPAAKCRVR